MTQIYPLSEEDRTKYSKISREYKLLKQEQNDLKQIISDIPDKLNDTLNIASKLDGYDTVSEILNGKFIQVQKQVNELTSAYQDIILTIDKIVNTNKTVVPGAQKICDACDIQSVFYIGNNEQNNDDNITDFYKCAVCYKESEDTHPNYNIDPINEKS